MVLIFLVHFSIITNVIDINSFFSKNFIVIVAALKMIIRDLALMFRLHHL